MILPQNHIEELLSRIDRSNESLENQLPALVTWGRLHGLKGYVVIQICRGWYEQSKLEKDNQHLLKEKVVPLEAESSHTLSQRKNSLPDNQKIRSDVPIPTLKPNVVPMSKQEKRKSITKTDKFFQWLTRIGLMRAVLLVIVAIGGVFSYLIWGGTFDRRISKDIYPINRSILQRYTDEFIADRDIVHLIYIDKSSSISDPNLSPDLNGFANELTTKYLRKYNKSEYRRVSNNKILIALGLCQAIEQGKDRFSNVYVDVIAFGDKAIPNGSFSTTLPSKITEDGATMSSKIGYLLDIQGQKGQNESNFIEVVQHAELVIKEFKHAYVTINIVSDMVAEYSAGSRKFAALKQHIVEMKQVAGQRVKLNIIQLPTMYDDKTIELNGWTNPLQFLELINTWQQPFSCHTEFVSLLEIIKQKDQGNYGTGTEILKVYLQSSVAPNVPVHEKGEEDIYYDDKYFFICNENGFKCIDNKVDLSRRSKILISVNYDNPVINWKIDNYENISSDIPGTRLVKNIPSVSSVSTNGQSFCAKIIGAKSIGKIDKSIQIYDNEIGANMMIPIYIRN